MSPVRLRSMLLCVRQGRPDAFRISAKHHFVHLALVIRKDKIQEDPHNSSNNERSLDNQVKTLLETLQMHIRSTVSENTVEPRRGDDVDESNTECDG